MPRDPRLRSNRIAGSLLAAVALFAAALSCGGGGASSGGAPAGCPPVPTCPPAPPRFGADVAPLLAAHCSPCHFAGGSEASRLFADYAHVFPQRGEILSQLARCAMPPPDGPSPLASADRTTITAWLVCGAAND